MKSDASTEFRPASTSEGIALSRALDDLRTIHYALTVRINGREVDVCGCCQPQGIRELWPCPTIRLVRRHARAAR